MSSGSVRERDNVRCLWIIILEKGRFMVEQRHSVPYESFAFHHFLIAEHPATVLASHKEWPSIDCHMFPLLSQKMVEELVESDLFVLVLVISAIVSHKKVPHVSQVCRHGSGK